MQGPGGRLVMAPEQEQQLRCPRCDSTNTKFCYYNNYNLSQPRHFCRSCRRYWTKGGALRNVPVGGGTRKGGSKRSTADASSVADAPKRPTGSSTEAHRGGGAEILKSPDAAGGEDEAAWSVGLSMYSSNTTGLE